MTPYDQPQQMIQQVPHLSWTEILANRVAQLPDSFWYIGAIAGLLAWIVGREFIRRARDE